MNSRAVPLKKFGFQAPGPRSAESAAITTQKTRLFPEEAVQCESSAPDADNL